MDTITSPKPLCDWLGSGLGYFGVTGPPDGSARLWRAPTESDPEAASFILPDGATDVFSPDSRWLMRHSSSNLIFWDTHSRADSMPLPAAPLNPAQTNRWNSFNFSPNGELFVTVGRKPGFHVWRMTNGAPEYVRAVSARSDLRGRPTLSPKGNWVALQNGLKEVVIWDTVSWREIGNLQEGTSDLTSFAFSPSGKLLAIAYTDGRTRFWHTGTWTKGQVIVGPAFKIYALAFSPDGHWLAIGSADATVRLHDMANGRFHILASDSGMVTSVAFSPESKTLAVSSLGGEVKLWNVASRREMITLKPHLTMVVGLTFSPDGQLMLTGTFLGGDPTRLWPAPDETDAAQSASR